MRRRPSITGSLAILAALVAATGALVYLASVVLIASGTEGRLRDQAREEAEARLSLVRSIVSRPIDTLAALVQLVERGRSGPSDDGALRQALEASYRGAADFSSLRIVDSRGIVTHGTPAQGSGLGLDLSGLKELRAARATNRPAWSNIHTGIAEGRREITLALPAGDSLILATLDFERIAGRILELAAYSKGGIAIIDSGGAYIMSLDQHLFERRWQDMDFVESRLRDPTRSAWSYLSHPEGLAMETEARLIPETGWYLLLTQRADWAAVAIRQSIVGAAILALASCGLALGLAALTSRRLIRDLRSAVECAAGSLEGKDGAEVRATAANLHFRETVAIVDGMARATARWRESERRFSALFEAAPIPLAIVDRFGAVLDLNRRFEETFGYAKRDARSVASIWQQAYPDPSIRADLERRWKAAFEAGGQGSLGPVEQRVACADGEARDFLVSASASGDQILASFVEITERKRAESAILKEEIRLKGLLSILQARAETRQEFLDHALDEAIRLTESEFGYIYFYDEATRIFVLNSWSTGVMKECLVQNPQSRYELEKTGIWGEAVRQRRPIIVNDFSADNPLKKGYPAGHVRLRRFLTVPVFSRDRIVAVVGAANKTEAYDETDILQLSLLMDTVWKEVERRDTAETAEARERALQRQGEGLLALFIGGKLLSGDRAEAARALTEAYARLSGVERASLWIFSEDASVIRCEDAFDASTEAHDTREELRSADFPDYSAALLRGELIQAAEVFADPRTRELPASYFAEHRIGSLLDAPVWIGGKVGAILSLETVEASRVWTPEDERFATLMATAASLALTAVGRREAVELARSRETALRTVLDAAPYAIVINSLDGRIVDVNAAYLRMNGYADASEVRNRRNEELNRSVDPARRDELKRELFSTGRLDYAEYRIRRPDGDIRDQVVSSRFIDYLGESCIVSLVVDVTPLKRAEAELKALNAELEAKVTLRTEDLADANLGLQAANADLARALEELKEAQSKILVSEKLAALGRLTAGIAHELNTPLAAIAASARFELKTLGEGLDNLVSAATRVPAEALSLLRVAREAAVETPGSPLTTDPPAERRARRDAETALAAAGLDNAEPLAEELVELGLARLAPRAAPFLVGPAGPDFLALLRGVVGAYRAARVTEDAVAKASRVVAALRTYSRGGEDEAPSAVQLGPQLRGIVDLYYNRTKRGIELSIDIPPGLAALARREAIARIWFNLLNNAVQAVGESGRIEISARGEGAEVLVSVRDSGSGIPQDLQPRIFEPFFTTKPAGEGTGLGLDIARRLARADGGDISFESEPGRTVFTVRLPAASTTSGSPA